MDTVSTSGSIKSRSVNITIKSFNSASTGATIASSSTGINSIHYTVYTVHQNYMCQYSQLPHPLLPFFDVQAEQQSVGLNDMPM